jgi:hypothetical protein
MSGGNFRSDLIMHANIPRAKKSIAGTRRLEIDIVYTPLIIKMAVWAPPFPASKIALKQAALEPLRPDMNHGEAKINIPSVKESFCICELFVNAESVKRIGTGRNRPQPIASDVGFLE